MDEIKSVPQMHHSKGAPRITCHVLDQTTGRPAHHIGVTLTFIHTMISFPRQFKAVTSEDGRISNWNSSAGDSIAEFFDRIGRVLVGNLVCSLSFETGAYFGEGKTFFPEVEVKFFVDPNGGHCHVPLLLGPWSYTTYRGS